MYRATHRQERAHEEGIWSVCWTSQGQILSGSVDETARIWSEELAPGQVLGGHRLGVLSIRANAAGTVGVTSSIDSCMRLWDLSTGSQAGMIEAGPVAAWTCDVGANDKLLAAGTQQGGVNIWDMQSREKVSSLETRDKFVMSVAFSPDGSKVAGGGQDGNINIFDVAQNTLLQKMEGHALPVRSLRFSPDGTLLYTASDDMRVNVYDVKRSSLVASFTGHTSWVLCVDCCPDQRHFASSGSDRTVKVWDMAGKECVHSFDSAHTDQVWGVAYSPNGDRLVSGGDDGVLQVYELS